MGARAGAMPGWTPSSNGLARALIARGLVPGDVAALALPRGVSLVVAMLSVSKAGGAFLPLDIRQPKARLAGTLHQARPKLILTAGDAAERVAAAGFPLLRLDDSTVRAEVEAGPRGAVTDAERVTPLKLDHPAYVIFTSGTTGVPKGAVLPHRGLKPAIDSLVRQAALTPESRILQFSAPSFDVIVAEVMMAFAAGGCLVIAPETARDGAALERLLGDQDITHALIPPAALAGLDPAKVGGLPVLLVAGEACPPALVAHWAPGRRMINAYGPTETTFCVTLSEPMQAGEPVLLGRPILGARLLVLDGWGRPVAPGAAGELHVSGAGIGLGYLNAPELTRERFYTDERDGARFYRTGDLVRWQEDGMLAFAGRIDDQIKLRGFRIEPDEIARVLERQPGVREARVIARRRPDAYEGEAGALRLLGYVLPEEGGPVTGAALRKALGYLLPDYMVPAAVMVVDAWPLTPHGKLDRAALPEPVFMSSHSIAPRTELEATLTRLMAEVLRLETVSVEDSFFELGGDSLLGVMLGLRIQAELGHEIGLGNLFAAPSVAALAEHIQTGAEPGTFDQVMLPLRSGGTKPPLFCIHPAPGLGLSYAALLHHLDVTRPVYTLQARSFSDPAAAPDSLDAIARDYVVEIRAIQPHGPYHLLGWSSGASIAHEIAVLLQEAGDTVPLLVSLDGYPAGPHYEMLLRLDIPAEELREGTRLLIQAYLEAGMRRHLASRQIVDDTTVEGMIRVQNEALPLVISGRSRRYEGDLILFTCLTPQGDIVVPPPESWAPHVTGRIETHAVPDDHTCMLMPNSAAVIGRVTDAALRRLDAGQSAVQDH